MSHQLSKTTIRALGKIVNDTPNHIAVVTIDTKQNFLILGKEHFYFVEHSSLSTGNASDLISIKYMRIRHIEYDEKQK